MRQKIFNKSNESRIKHDLDPKLCNYWLRSARIFFNSRIFFNYCTTGISWCGFVTIYSSHDYNDFAPVCMI